MKRFRQLVARGINLGVTPHTAPSQARSIRFANGFNWILILISPAWMLAEAFGSSMAEIKQFSFLLSGLLLTISAVHLVVSYLGLSHLARIMLVLDFPAVIFLFPVFTSHVGPQDLLWFPYILVGLSVVPHLLFDARQERLLFWLGLAYIFTLILFSPNAIVNTVVAAGQNHPLLDLFDRYYFYYQRTVVAVWFMVNLPLFYQSHLISRTEKDPSIGQEE